MPVEYKTFRLLACASSAAGALDLKDKILESLWMKKITQFLFYFVESRVGKPFKILKNLNEIIRQAQVTYRLLIAPPPNQFKVWQLLNMNKLYRT